MWTASKLPTIIHNAWNTQEHVQNAMGLQPLKEYKNKSEIVVCSKGSDRYIFCVPVFTLRGNATGSGSMAIPPVGQNRRGRRGRDREKDIVSFWFLYQDMMAFQFSRHNPLPTLIFWFCHFYRVWSAPDRAFWRNTAFFFSWTEHL